MLRKYEIDRNDDSFLKEALLIDVSTFDFDSKEFEDAVDRSIRRQEEIDQMKYSSTDAALSSIVCTL
ncbi:MAG: hypothetical protein IPG87_07820 [Saprospiraceae bacterium]|nr:hypothetical protein [Candidatus Vicinibacter affinis]